MSAPTTTAQTHGATRATDRPITVLALETSMRIGGTETMLSQMLPRLDRRRFRAILCCVYELGALGERVQQAGVTVYHDIAKRPKDALVGSRLLQIVRREQPDVMFIVNQPLTQFWGTAVAALARVPVRIAAIRSTGKVDRIRRRMLINRILFPMMTRVTCLSDTHRRYLIEHERIPARQLEIVTNGVDLSRFERRTDASTVRRALGLADDQPVVGIVAMLRPEKAHDVFLRAVAEATRALPRLQALIVGEGTLRPSLEALAAELGITGNVRFLGARYDVPALIGAMDVAVLSSHPVVETLSNAVLEYMAGATPVVATRVGSVPEQVEDGKTGFLVDPGDWRALGERMRWLLQHRDDAARMGRAGRERVVERYTIDRMVQQHEALFERLVRDAQPHRRAS